MRGRGWSLLLGSVLAGCAVNPATGGRDIMLISEGQEIQIGQQGVQQITASQAALDNPGLTALVEGMGTRMAAASERPRLPWTFHVLDDPIVNAFAVPGGGVFFTRGILTHFNSEAELAAVMGHEIAHITARHSARAISRQTAAGLGLGLAAILSPQVADLAGIAQQGLGLLFLKFGRGDESEADALGFRYALDAGYDMRAMPKVFEMLGRVGGGGSRLPEWASTHPNPDRREQVAQARVDSVRRDWRQARLGRDEYLRLLDGVVVGPDPRKGYFEGRRFVHPDLAFRLDFPEGWRTENRDDAVAAGEPQGRAVVDLTLAQGTPDEAAGRFAGQQGVTVTERGTLATGAGTARVLVFRAQGQQQPLEGLAAWVATGGRTYRIMGLTAQGGLGAVGAAFRATAQSLAPVTDPAVLGVQPDRLALVRLPRGMAATEFLRAYPSSVPDEQVLLLNNLTADDRVPAGTTLKRVVRGR